MKKRYLLVLLSVLLFGCTKQQSPSSTACLSSSTESPAENRYSVWSWDLNQSPLSGGSDTHTVLWSQTDFVMLYSPEFSQGRKIPFEIAEVFTRYNDRLLFLGFANSGENRYLFESGLDLDDIFPVISQDISEYRLIGDTVIFSAWEGAGLFACDLLTKEIRTISADYDGSILVADDRTLFFQNRLDGDKLYEMNLQTGHSQKILDMYVSAVCIVDEMVYVTIPGAMEENDAVQLPMTTLAQYDRNTREYTVLVKDRFDTDTLYADAYGNIFWEERTSENLYETGRILHIIPNQTPNIPKTVYQRDEGVYGHAEIRGEYFYYCTADDFRRLNLRTGETFSFDSISSSYYVVPDD